MKKVKKRMPDLKSELLKLNNLKFDDDDEPTQQEITVVDSARVSVSATMFNVIRDNPGSSRNRLLSLAADMGVGRESSSSLLSQFIKRGLVRVVGTHGVQTYFTVPTEYVRGSPKNGAVKKLKVDHEPQNEPAVSLASVAPVDMSVQAVLGTMSIVKARALYDELKKIFGG